MQFQSLAVSCLLSTAYAAPWNAPPWINGPGWGWPGPPSNNQNQIPLTVDLGYSQYQGATVDNGINQYLGMRYAAPPVGDLRFRGPADPVYNATVQPATEFGPLCVAVDSDSSTTSEDCLFINVFTPSNATTSSKLPVWFFITGGGYAALSNADYTGTDVIPASNHSIVLVNFNYRVGAYGFLASDKVRQDGDLNAGLLDERKALEWVQKYIHLFGGDPDHVVIHGESAGAGSVAHHLTWAGGRNDDLFIGVMAQSPFFPTERTVPEMEFQFDRFADDVGCNANTTDVMDCLRSKTTKELDGGNVMSPFPGGKNTPDFYWLPVIDGIINLQRMDAQFESGQFVKVPVFVGDDATEGGDFTPSANSNAAFLQFIKDNYPHLTDQDLQKVNETYPITELYSADADAGYCTLWFGPASAAYGDATFTCAGNLIADSFAAYFDPRQTWSYEYDVLEPDANMSCNPVPHTIGTPAVFGPAGVDCTDCSYLPGKLNAPIVPIYMSYYISFIKSLDPNPYRDLSSPYWEPFGRQQNRLIFQLDATRMSTVSSEQNQRCDLWTRILAPDMEQ